MDLSSVAAVTCTGISTSEESMRINADESSAGAALAGFARGRVCTLLPEDAWNASPMAQNCIRQAILAACMYPFIIV